MRCTDGNLWKGAAAGLAAGVAASWVMNQFQNLSGKLGKVLAADEPQNPQHSSQRGDGESAEQEDEDATVKAADAISRKVFHHPLSQQGKKIGGPAVHYGFGGLTGAVYGALAEVEPGVTWGAGLPFGTSVWLGADEVAVPALRLSGPPWEHPPGVHARALAAHLVYGLTAEKVRRLVRQAL